MAMGDDGPLHRPGGVDMEAAGGTVEAFGAHFEPVAGVMGWGCGHSG